MPAGRVQLRFPEHLGIQMGVKVDNPRRDNKVCCVNFLSAFTRNLPDPDNGCTIDGNVTAKRVRF